MRRWIGALATSTGRAVVTLIQPATVRGDIDSGAGSFGDGPARNATMDGAPVRARLGEAGLRVVHKPYQAPNANAYAERFVTD